MTLSVFTDWQEDSRRYSMARLAVVRERLASFCLNQNDESDLSREPATSVEAAEREADSIAAATEPQPALDHLCEGFGLSSFERDLLLLCLGCELDADFSRLFATAHGNPQMTWPTFRLGLALFPDAHWSAITPGGPLRYWRLIEIERGETLTTSPLRIDERVLHYLVGGSYLDERLGHFVELVGMQEALPASYETHVERVARIWGNKEGGWPIIHLSGNARAGHRPVAAASCVALGLRLHALRVTEIPSTPLERETLLRLWQRESLLLDSALFLETEDGVDANALRNGRIFARRLKGPVFTSGDSPAGNPDEAMIRIKIERPTAAEQRGLWELALGPAAEKLNGQLDQILSQFQFDAEGIRSAGAAVADMVLTEQVADPAEALWQVCRAESRRSLDGLAESIETRARWEDLVLPEEQHQTLAEIAAQVRQRMKVYESWGFAARSNRGLGISALFAGPSGTGKTLAAEVLANNLQLDLFRIDLSQVVSKYIGETEKNLRAVFDSAESCGAVLLFDEADALFGKRSEVRDSHDRYANIEVSYLLQRMESYRGLAILTTNRRSSLDTAFLRRIRFVVSFPFPDATLRSRIWSGIFPHETPTQNLDLAKLARLNVTGGNIRNIALNAAFLAADLNEPVRMTHLLRTARSECAKIEKQLTAAEIGGWV
jgi:hypothetical protein